MPVYIQLTKGAVAVVDETDAPLVIGEYRWQLNSKGPHRYAQTRMLINGRRRTVQMHRIIMSAPSGMSVDHIDGDGLNNCRSNLRLVSRGQNRANSIKRKEAACLFKGVYKKDMKWGAQISSEKLPSSPWYIGTFDTAADAARAYDAVARILFSDHARLNFPRTGERSAITGGIMMDWSPNQRPAA